MTILSTGSGVSTHFKSDGAVVMGQEECREGLAKFFEELYNVHAPAESLASGVQHIVVAPIPSIWEDPPSCLEVWRAVSELKGV